MNHPRVTIASVVEGEGEISALPVLLRRLMYEVQIWDADIQPPFLVDRGRLVRPGGLEAAVEAQARRVPADHPGGILVVIDADDDCPASLGPSLLARAEAARPDRRTAVVLANREFEAWFLASAPSLGGRAGLAERLEVPANSETLRDCKGWLTHHRRDGVRYRPRVDQAALTDVINLDLDRANSSSFDKFCRDITYLVTGKRGE
ncbi:hypothetical protein SBI_03806 [Streptomyces bingchenggensis BCW-1]|uniref:DUF4276 family protein n=1 Tax=Streptomyces bingchenggensis (strain BCW-1) TaxID=749414 RepID=D7CG19_STRBB|nr:MULTISPECIES: DUF4276 family protein [Streptomyces]ADI06927.1 hypothetical protein SBI_03806 [Streptomyces bingchenggensis BCW-1]